MSYNIPLDPSGDVDFTGTMTANAFVGDGSGLINLPLPVSTIDTGSDYTWAGDNTFEGDTAFTSNTYVDTGSFVQNVIGVEGDTDRLYIENSVSTNNVGTPSEYTNVWTRLAETGAETSKDNSWRIGLKDSWGMLFNKAGFIIQESGAFRIGAYDAGASGLGFVTTTFDLGLDFLRWPKVWGVNASFNGTFDIESGGSQRLYNLGTDGDTDTEYLEMRHDGTRFVIDGRTTGAGTNQEVGIGRAGSMSMIHSGSGGTRSRSVVPQINDTYQLGIANLRWANVASINGDFSGTVDVNRLTLGGDTNTYIQNIGGSDWMGFTVAGLTFLGMLGSGINKEISFNSNDVDINFKVGSNGGTAIDMDGATGNVTFGADTIINSGGSQRVYNLGTDGDADTEYLEIESTGTSHNITAKLTGNGVKRSFILTGASDDYISFYPTGGVIFGRSGTQIATFKTSDCAFNAPIVPSVTEARAIGTTAKRWSDVYSVDGDFSGTVTTNTIESDAAAGNMFIKSSSTSPIYIGHNGALTFSFYNTTFQPQNDDAVQLGTVTKRWSQGHFANVNSVNGDFSGRVLTTRLENVAGSSYIRVSGQTSSPIKLWRNTAPQGDNAFDMGADAERFRTVYSVDGSFSGNLNVEDGGAFQFYGLGTEGDTDTEFLRFDTIGSDYELTTSSTGNGVAGSLYISAAGSANVMFRSDHTRIFQYLRPQTTNTVDIGTDALRFRKSYFVDGDFSGTVRLGSWVDSGLTGFVETVLPTADNESFYLRRGWSGGSSSGRIGISTDYNAAGTAKNSIGVTPTLVEVIIANGLKAVWQAAGNQHRLNMHFRPMLDSTYDNGYTNVRWRNTYSVNGSYSGNLNVESGGSQRVYNLGTDGDTDTEYLDISWDANILKIFNKATGSGTARNLEFGSTNCQFNIKPSQDQAVIRTGGSARFVVQNTNTAIWNTTNFYPQTTSVTNLGTATYRWLNIYSVGANFSGTVTANAFVGDGSQLTNLPSGGGSVDTGDDFTWTGDHVFEGSVNLNTLVTEIGGSYKLYNIGTEGDTDTEYLETSWDTNTASIFSKTTGTGVLRELTVGNADNRFRFTSGGVICAVNSVTKLNIGSNFTYLGSSVAVLPDTDGTIELGRDAARWQNVASVDGDFSGDVIMAANVDFTGLPTTDPLVAGRMWNDSGDPKISAGGGAPPP